MSEDIFIPNSDPKDARVGQLHAVTYVTSNKALTDSIFRQGYGLDGTDWWQPSPAEFEKLNPYLGFEPSHTWEACSFSKKGEGRNAQVRVIHIHQETPAVRPDYDGLYKGGATVSFPINDLYAHEKVMQELGVQSTIGVKEMEFTSPAGKTYISAEIVYKAPDNIYVLGVRRPDVFVPVGPIDPATGIGGAAYSARCTSETDATIEFLEDVLGYEIRRDTELVIGEKSATLLPPNTKMRFVQAFAPGARTGYLILMDHEEARKLSPIQQYGPPSRGIVMWSFPTRNLDEVYERAQNVKGTEILSPPDMWGSPFLPSTRSVMLKDPDGFAVEVFEEL